MIAPNSDGEICLTLKQQEIALDHPHSRNRFLKPFHATPGACKTFGVPLLLFCLVQLQKLAADEDGLDYMQVFETEGDQPNLWFIEDGQVVTALLPSEY